MSKQKKNEEIEAEVSGTSEAQTNMSKLQKVIQQEANERAQKCQMEIQAILEKHNCGFDYSFTVSTQGITPNMRVVAKLQ